MMLEDRRQPLVDLQLAMTSKGRSGNELVMTVQEEDDDWVY